MAYRRRIKRTTRKGRGKGARRWRRSRKVVIPRTMVSTGIGFPKKLLMTHKYVDTFTLTQSSGGNSFYVMSCNGLYDPNITGTGHQPLYFDQLTTLYNHYVVIGAKCTFKFTHQAAYNVVIKVTALVEDAASLTSGNFDAIAEQTQGKAVTLLPANNAVTHRKTLTYSSRKFFGKNPLSNSNLRGSSSANPSEQAYFTLVATGDGITSTALTCTAEITYTAIWFELKDVAQS